MSIRSEPTLWCDAAVRADACFWWTNDGMDSADMRRIAKSRGWKRIGRLDLCPRCAALAPAPLEGEGT